MILNVFAKSKNFEGCNILNHDTYQKIIDHGTIFHIDFGYMLGEKVSGIDTSKIAITADLSKLMGSKWNDFVAISVNCWVVLRENHQKLLDFAKLAFSFLYPQEIVQEFLKKTLLLHLSEEDGRRKIHKRLKQAPKKLKTKMKNFVHMMATSRDKSHSHSEFEIRERSHSPSFSQSMSMNESIVFDEKKQEIKKEKMKKEKTKKNIFNFLTPKRKPVNSTD